MSADATRLGPENDLFAFSEVPNPKIMILN